MDHEQYLERLRELTSMLQAAGNARPYNPAIYNCIIDELNTLHVDQPAEKLGKPNIQIKSRAGKRIYAAAARLKKILKKVWII